MKKKIYLQYLLSLLLIMSVGFFLSADDKELFMGYQIGSNTVRPNVVILMDNSGSMNTIIFYPKKGLDGLTGTDDDGFDPIVSYSGSFENYGQVDSLSSTYWIGRWVVNGNAYEYDDNELEGIGGKNHWTGCYAGDGTPNNFQVGNNGTSYFLEGDQVMFRDTSSPYYDAIATIQRKYTDVDGNTWFELTDIVGGPITVNGGRFQRCPEGYNRKPVVIKLYGVSDMGNSVRYPQNYIEWLYLHASAAQQEAVSHFADWATFDVTKQPPAELSNCATPGNDDINGTNPRIKATWTRIQTAREVICTVATNSNDVVKLGLFKFVFDNGAELVEGLADMSDESSELVAYKNNVWGIEADTWTPLAEALADIWYYYKPGPSSKTRWPVDYEIEHNTVNHSTSNPVGPIDYWCQNNYVVLMTDGESTQDRFDDSGKYGDSIFRQKPVKRSTAWASWDDGWGDTDNNEANNGIPSGYNPNGEYCPNYTCWYTDSGSDYLDDVAYFLLNQDMYPDDYFGADPNTGWPGDQNIVTYTIGFNADSHMLAYTAENGEGAYYTATNYEELVNAFQLVITSINLRNFGFSSITAPRKTATATNQDLTLSYVGYFKPSQSKPIWEGHLLAFELKDLWGFDADGSEVVEAHEYIYETEDQCLSASQGQSCWRSVDLAIGHDWDADDQMPLVRNLQTHLSGGTENVAFDLTNRDILLPYFGVNTTEEEAEQIIDKINDPQLGDIFHSDVGFIGPPSEGKKYRSNLNPTGSLDESYATYYETNKNRDNVLYVGTNDGIFHMFYADGVNAGREIWGFIPNEVLPSLRTIAIDKEHTYTVDGRLSANDVYFQKSGQSVKTWSTVLTFGLRRGGNSYYTMDITNVNSTPDLLWTFNDPVYSGQSWGKPVIARIRLLAPNSDKDVLDRYVAFFTGGFAYNSENSDDSRGKAIFMVDIGTGELLWRIAYNKDDGAADGENSPNKEYIEMSNPTGDNIHYYTKSDYFNFCIPTSFTAIDIDNDGFADSFYFGNVGGHLFKTDISSYDINKWTTYLIYKTNITTKASTTISSMDALNSVITVASKLGFEEGDSIMGKTSNAYGYIREIDNKNFTIMTQKGTFLEDEEIVSRTYDPIYLSPALAFDNCYRLWVTFGTGDRDRPRTSNHVGKFIAIKETGETDMDLNDLTNLSWGSQNDQLEFTQQPQPGDKGWYFSFRDNHEKLFDPDPIILPDENRYPHIYFNTYQPPTDVVNPAQDNPCAAPSEGIMTFYDLSLQGCGTTEESIVGERGLGRIAGGGIYNSREYVLYKSTSGEVADVPGSDETITDRFSDGFEVKLPRIHGIGGLLFWKETKR